MDELAAAAAVVSMSVDDFAEVNGELEVAEGSATHAEAETPTIETLHDDKENERDLPEGCVLGAANPKVTNAPKLAKRPSCVPAFL